MSPSHASMAPTASSDPASSDLSPPATAPAPTPTLAPVPVTPFVRRCTAVACLGGCLYGYDTGVISGALPSLSASLQLSDSQAETVVAFLFIGSALGAFIGGNITDRLGRKSSILMCDGIFMVGSLVLGLAPTYGVVLFGRIVIGIAVAISAIADVSYLTEISPEAHRGALVSCNEASISLGFLLAYVVSYLVTVSISYDSGWRLMFGISGLIALVQFALMKNLPESPVWLAEKGRVKEAEEAFALVRAGDNKSVRDEPIDGDDSASEFADPVHDAVVGVGGDEFGPLPTNEEQGAGEAGEVSLKPIPLPPAHSGYGEKAKLSLSVYWRHVIIALFLAVAQQICGHVNVLNYAPAIFSEVFSTSSNQSSSLLATTVILGVLKFLLTTFVIFEVDKIGRRFLLLSGVFIITISLLLITAAYTLGSEQESEFTYTQRGLAVVGCSGVVAGYALSYAPLTWLIVSEVFPSSIRGRALGMTTITTNAAAALISYSFLSGQDIFGAAAPFAAYFVLSLGSLIFAFVAIPDTGNSNADDIDHILAPMPLWKMPCCRGSLCARRQKESAKMTMVGDKEDVSLSNAATVERIGEEEEKEDSSSGIIT